MAQGGATDTGYSEQFIENIVKYIDGKTDLIKELQELLKDNEDFKNLNKEFNELSVEDVTNLLKNSKEVLDNVVKHFTENKKDLEILIEQANKVKDMEGKLEALGNQLLIQGVIGGTAITALTGALAGTLAIGGVAGALMGGGLALAGLVALVAIVAIGYAIYQHRGEVKEGIGKTGEEVKGGMVEWGKAIKSLVKDFIDNLPTIQKREDNFAKLNSDLLEQYRKSTGEEQTTLNNKIEIIRMLQDKDQRSAIEKLVEKGEIKDFSEDEMKRLIEKGLRRCLQTK
ncbi:MAG: glycine zipper family protein [Wolbachia endosymbiont of Menacanthus eurysternus]|nr:glycine zipper family protein [Wolbachia endosymbiont of Menacanthus eurysternus]